MSANGMTEIERLTSLYAAAYQDLSEEAGALVEKIEQIKRQHLAEIKKAVARSAERKAALKAAIEAALELFERPRTVVIAGIKVGWQKGKGKLVLDDPDAVVERIDRLLPEQAETLISTYRVPNKTGLVALDAGALKRLGCRIEGTGDEVVIRPVDGEVEKVVEALLKGAESEGT